MLEETRNLREKAKFSISQSFPSTPFFSVFFLTLPPFFSRTRSRHQIYGKVLVDDFAKNYPQTTFIPFPFHPLLPRFKLIPFWKENFDWFVRSLDFAGGHFSGLPGGFKLVSMRNLYASTLIDPQNLSTFHFPPYLALILSSFPPLSLSSSFFASSRPKNNGLH